MNALRPEARSAVASTDPDPDPRAPEPLAGPADPLVADALSADLAAAIDQGDELWRLLARTCRRIQVDERGVVDAASDRGRGKPSLAEIQKPAVAVGGVITLCRSERDSSSVPQLEGEDGIDA
jgi:hypothetical protein